MPTGVYKRKPQTLEMVMRRFWGKVEKSGECWLWLGSHGKGYGRFSIDGVLRGAHRVAFEWLRGPIKSGLVIDHLCRNPICVNPAHMEAVTNRENIMRGYGIAAKEFSQTHCKYGHQLPPAIPGKERPCKTCNKMRSKAYYATNRESLLAAYRKRYWRNKGIASRSA